MILSLCPNIIDAASPSLDPAQRHISLQKQRRESMFEIPLEVLHEYIKHDECASHPLNLTIPNEKWAYGIEVNGAGQNVVFDPNLTQTAAEISAIIREYAAQSNGAILYVQASAIEAIKNKALRMCAVGSFDLAYFLMHYGPQFGITIPYDTFDAYPELVKPHSATPPYEGLMRQKLEEIQKVMTNDSISLPEKRGSIFKEEVDTQLNLRQLITEDEQFFLLGPDAQHKATCSLWDWMQGLGRLSNGDIHFPNFPPKSLQEIRNKLKTRLQKTWNVTDFRDARLATHHVLFDMLMHGQYTPFFTHLNDDFYALLFLMDYYKPESSAECLNHYMPNIVGSLILQYEKNMYPSQNEQIQQIIQNWSVIRFLRMDKDWLENVGSSEKSPNAIYKISRPIYEKNMDRMFGFVLSGSKSAREWYRNYIHLIPKKRFEGYPFDDLPWLKGLSKDLQFEFLLIMRDIVKRNLLKMGSYEEYRDNVYALHP